jgi:seryl-tRNA synthetase
MLSRELLRNETGKVRDLVAVRGTDPALVDDWVELDGRRRKILSELEELKRRRNEASRKIGEAKRTGENADDLITEVGELKSRLGTLETDLTDVEGSLNDIGLALPNIAHDSVPVGVDEAANRVERHVGEPPEFDFEPKAHWDLGPELGILDFERGAKVAGARFTTYFGDGARLERALINFMIDLHTREHGYREVLPPFIVNGDALVGTGQLPKFGEDLFRLEGHDYYLIPTAEVPVTNLHRQEILEEDQLPIKYVAFTPCFRAEAGSYGRDVRGLIRQHQFNKVELVHLTTPETSYQSLEDLTSSAEQVVCLSSGDMGFGAAKTYDLEVWLPGQSAYREISSCSNCEAFQARRAGLRYRPSNGGKPRYLHSLNGSGLAVGRTLVALLENYQRADGTIGIPGALRSYFDGRDTIAPAE